MSKDRLERKTYRRSPGRQYGYEYDPLHTQSHGTPSQSGQSRSSAPGQQAVQLAPRPDPRRTRQLLRQNILASKAKNALSGDPGVEGHDEQDINDQVQAGLDEYEDSTLYVNRYPRADSPRRTQILPRQSVKLDRETEEGEWVELGYADHHTDVIPQNSRLVTRPVHRSDPVPSQPRRVVRRSEPPEVYEQDAEDRERARERRKAKRKKVSRRRLLLGIGSVVAGGAVAAAGLYELPKVPQTIDKVGKNIEQELQNAFNQGFNAGADAVRKEFIMALENLEGISLDAAMAAAKLTRVAYDIFVSPLVKFLAGIADDFLSVTLRAFIQARHWLHNIGQDNNTLAGLQNVLQTWETDAQQLPKQLQAIADTDLDGAQAYLRALRRKIEAEQAKLNAQKTTPTTTPVSKPTSTSKP